MSDRRNIHTSRVGLRDRRVRWADRRQHSGPFRFFFIDVRDLVLRTASLVLSIL